MKDLIKKLLQTFFQTLDYANQHNPNNKAYNANILNRRNSASKSKYKQKYDVGILDGESYGWCDD